MAAPIMSDDPTAIPQLQARVAAAEKLQERMKTANSIIKKFNKPGSLFNVTDELVKAGFSEAQASQLLKPDFCGRIGFPPYELTNNNANIKRMKDRLIEITAKQADVATEEVINGVTLSENVEENRVQLFFDGKPPRDVIEELKRRGFKWSPTRDCWQRHRSSEATYQAKKIIDMMPAVGPVVAPKDADGTTETWRDELQRAECIEDIRRAFRGAFA